METLKILREYVMYPLNIVLRVSIGLGAFYG
jgi:hypothetical protein